jgi:alkylation response protein AidB-like acyl-CoA dehydrogenase
MAEESAKLVAFRKEVRNWLRENLPKGWGTPEFKMPEAMSPERQQLGIWWTKKCYDAGYTGFGYPKEYGGIERPVEERVIIREEMARTGTPPGPMSLGLLLAAPTILRAGQEWQKKRFLPKILSGEESWCEGFSEPNAGSDLANVQTTAVRDGDEWVVNGQKVWSSNSKFADFGVLLTKTDMQAPRHRNLTYFLFDCKVKGFDRRPLRQMTGEAEFGEMFFDGMRVPHTNMVGELNRGWYVAMATLGAERGGGGGIAAMAATEGGRRIVGAGTLDLIELAKNIKRYGKTVWEDPYFRQKIMEIAIESEALRYSGVRNVARLRAKGEPPGNEVSMSKNFSAELRQRRGELSMDIIGAYSQMMRGSLRAIDDGDWVYASLRAKGATIEMGTSEVNRNIIAERMLGLPR